MMKDNILLAQGGKNKIFIFDSYGRLFKIIDVSDLALVALLIKIRCAADVAVKPNH